jgi:membrane protein YdbS with pleckstrin-like domain
MRIASIQKIRIPLLLALACSELAAIFILRGQPSFRVFVAASIAVVLLIVPLLWIQEIWRRNITYFVFVPPAVAVSLVIDELLLGRGLGHAPWSMLFIPFAILISTKRDNPRSNEPSEEQYRVRRAEDIRFFWVCANIAGIVTCFVYLAHLHDEKWISLILFIALLFLCGIVYFLFVYQPHTSSSEDPRRNELGTGGRA